MISPNIQGEAANWQEKYSASQSQWQDMKRTGKFILILASLLVIATLYAVSYVTNQFDRWLLATPSQTLFYVRLLQILLTILAPTITMFVGLSFIFKQTKDFVIRYYQLTGNERLANIIQNRLLGIPPLPSPLNRIIPYPFIIIKEQRLYEDKSTSDETHSTLDENHWARLLGGPATLVIYDGTAVYLERDNSFSRVVGPSFPPPFLERFERIKEIIDLRPQTKSGLIEPWTKDGIRIKLTLRAEVQIDAGAEALEKSSNLIYPFDPFAVKKAVEFTSVALTSDGSKERTWLEGTWGVLTTSINSYIANLTLGELLLSSKTDIDLESINKDFSESITQIVTRKVLEAEFKNIQKELKENGIKILDIRLTHIDIPKDIFDMCIKYLELVRRKNTAVKDVQVEADRIRAIGNARVDSKRATLAAITDKLKNLDQDHLTEQLLLFASNIVDEEMIDPTSQPLIRRETLSILSRMFELLKISL